ncbi:hypothetical protein EBZ80_20120 [bacterium]|nr:hypothetical protein [bacterium]
MAAPAPTIVFEFSASLIGTSEAPWDAILVWYRDMATDYLEEMPGLDIEHVGRGVFRGSFSRTEDTPAEPRYMIEGFVDPDEDGNHPIKCGRKKYLVHGELRSINSVPVVVD